MNKFALLLFVLIPLAALAENVGWEHPATRTDGSPISLSDIKHYEVKRNSSTFIVTPQPGTHQVYNVVRELGTNNVSVVAVDQFNVKSTPSNQITVLAATPTPLPTATPTATPLPPIAAPVIQQVP